VLPLASNSLSPPVSALSSHTLLVVPADRTQSTIHDVEHATRDEAVLIHPFRPVVILGFLPFIPDSPRWLLSKDREADAVHALRRLRTPEEVSLGHCEAELSAIHEALRANVHKASWSAVFRGSNLRRTLVVLVGFTYQQITGQAFVSTYQTVFYKSNGYAAQAFTFPVINGVLGTLAVIPGMFLVDSLGWVRTDARPHTAAYTNHHDHPADLIPHAM
jgi:hypothetical protein